MKLNIIAAIVASSVFVNAEDQNAHRFQDLLTQVRMTQNDESFGKFMNSLGPVSTALGLGELINQRTLAEGFNPMQIVAFLTNIDNGVTAFHSDVDAIGGNATFKNNSNYILASYTNGLIGHMNSNNAVSPKMANLTIALQQVDNLAVDIAYSDMYKIFHDDYMLLLENALPLMEPVMELVSDIKNITEEVKILLGDGPERRLLESIQNFAEETHRSLSIIDDIEGFVCKLVPMLEKLVNVIEFATQVSVDKLVTDLVDLLVSIHSDKKIIEFITNIMEKAEAFLNRYGPLIHNEIIPVVEDVIGFVGKLCNHNQHGSRLLASPRMLSADIVAKIFDFIEDLVKFLQTFLSELPTNLIDDLLKVIEDLGKLLFKGAKGQAVVYIGEDISSILSVLPQVLQGLDTLLPVLEITTRDIIQLFDDAKAMIEIIINLVKSLF